MLKLFGPHTNMDLDALYLWHSIHIPSVHRIKYSLHSDAELIIPLDLDEVLLGYMPLWPLENSMYTLIIKSNTGLLLIGPLETNFD